MHLTLIRKIFSPQSTIGELHIDGKFECFTLEDAVRAPGIKIPGRTAISYGTYDLIIDYSKRFMRNMPHILAVPGFEGIRIHSGNTSSDTEGCILVGRKRGKDMIYESKDAFVALYQKLEKGLRDGAVMIEITPNDSVTYNKKN